MSISSSFSGKSADPMVTDPGSVGSAVPPPCAGLDAGGADDTAGAELDELLVVSGAGAGLFPELPLLPHAARVKTPSAAGTARSRRLFIGPPIVVGRCFVPDAA